MNLKRFLTWEYQTGLESTELRTGPCRTKSLGSREWIRQKKIQQTSGADYWLSRHVLWTNRNPRVAELFIDHDHDHDRWPDDPLGYPLGHPLFTDIADEPKVVRVGYGVHTWLIDLIKSIILAIGLEDYRTSYPRGASLLLPKKVTIFGLDTDEKTAVTSSSV